MELSFVRFENRILDLSSGKVTEFPSINLAKKESRNLQGRVLGNGVLRVASTKIIFNRHVKSVKEANHEG